MNQADLQPQQQQEVERQQENLSASARDNRDLAEVTAQCVALVPNGEGERRGLILRGHSLRLLKAMCSLNDFSTSEDTLTQVTVALQFPAVRDLWVEGL